MKRCDDVMSWNVQRGYYLSFGCMKLCFRQDLCLDFVFFTRHLNLNIKISQHDSDLQNCSPASVKLQKKKPTFILVKMSVCFVRVTFCWRKVSVLGILSR